MGKSPAKAFKGVVARTENQKRLLQCVNEKDITIVDAVIGTGKTFLAVGLACEYLVKGKVEKIVLARTTKHMLKEVGFLPGDLAVKSIAMFDQAVEYFIRFLGEQEFKKLWNEKVIEFCSASTIRGRSLYKTFYICEEMQETCKDDWILMLSRLDKESKFLAIGDRWQNGGNEGFFGKLFDNLDDEAVGRVMMTEEDVQRNKHIYRICKKIREIDDAKERKSKH